MLVRSVALACSEGNSEVTSIYVVNDVTDDYLQRFIAMDDESLVQSILDAKENPSAKLMRRLRQRRLVKEVLHEPLYRCGDAVFRENIRTLDGKKELENKIANQCSKPDWEVFIDLQQGRPLRKGIGEAGPETIFVIDQRGGRSNYDEVSPVLKYAPLREEDYISVYLPIEDGSAQQQIQDRAKCASIVQELVQFQADKKEVSRCSRCSKELPERDKRCCKLCGLPFETEGVSNA